LTSLLAFTKSMATCPRCGGFLGSNHRCRGVWRLKRRALLAMLIAATIGGALTWLTFLVFFGQASAVVVAIGALVGLIIERELLRGPR
jgi:hypothetical protein